MFLECTVSFNFEFEWVCVYILAVYTLKEAFGKLIVSRNFHLQLAKQKKFKEVRETIKTKLVSLDSKTNFTCDIWTYPNQKSIFVVTGHWATHQFGLKELFFDVV